MDADLGLRDGEVVARSQEPGGDEAVVFRTAALGAAVAAEVMVLAAETNDSLSAGPVLGQIWNAGSDSRHGSAGSAKPSSVDYGGFRFSDRTADRRQVRLIAFVRKELTKIGVRGFEPPTSWSRTKRSSQAEPHPGPDTIISRPKLSTQSAETSGSRPTVTASGKAGSAAAAASDARASPDGAPRSPAGAGRRCRRTRGPGRYRLRHPDRLRGSR